ncbi:hypothetical protein, partial [Ilumatobacter sp.]|uniref:hypothetical protein n=1 Tax=Ilumatobacter sp. TaxID=1967498 RepID=UPI003C329DB6
MASSVAIRRGADADIVAEARSDPSRPVHQRLRAIRWASALARDDELPKRFRPADLRNAPARRAAISALERRVETIGDLQARESLISMGDQWSEAELADAIAADISLRLAQR